MSACYMSLGTRVIEDRRGGTPMVQGSEGREEEPFIMVQGRRKKKQKKEKGLQPPATTRPALPPPPGRHCRWAHPGTAGPSSPALPAPPALPPRARRHCRPPRSQLHPNRLFIIYGHQYFIVMPLLPLDGSGPIYSSSLSPN